jgi:hypothetical protein
LVSLKARTFDLRPRGTKLGLVSFIGNRVVGSTSPTPIPSKEDSKSLRHSSNVDLER